jgi:ribose transport system permease protein
MTLKSIFARFGLIIIIVMFFSFFSYISPVFLTFDNQVNIIEASAIVLILALGMTLIVAMGGIDLSIGIAFDFGAAFAVVALKDFGVAWYVACLVGVMLNAVLIVILKISPFMATLGTFFVGSSVERVFTNGGGPISYRRMPQEYRDLAVGDVFGIPTEVIIAAAVCVVYFIVLERSIFGKRIHAIGLQKDAANVAGIPVRRYMFIAFILASATCAIGGLIGSANIRMFTPLAGFSYLLDAIAAVFIGAAIHPKGRPNVIGTIVGVLFLGMIGNGLNLMGLDFNLKAALSGLILVGALALAVAQQRFR